MYRDFARLEDRHWWFEGRRAVVRAVLRKRLPAHRSRRILDVGCGTGGMLKMLSEFGEVEGLESSEEGLGYCRQRFPGTPLHRGQLPDGIPSGAQYELITAFDVLEHIADVVGSLTRLREALSPEGCLVATVPAYRFLWSEHDVANHHQRRYTRRLLAQHLEQGGFQPTWISYFNSALFPPIAAARLGSRLIPWKANGESDFGEAPAVINRLLQSVFSAERFLVPHWALPFGVSIIAVARPR